MSGTAITEPFTVSTNDNSVPASPGGLPNSSSTKLPAGKAQTYNVKVTNNGPTTEEYFVDARLPGSAPLSLTVADRPGYDGAAYGVEQFPGIPGPHPQHAVHRGGQHDRKHSDHDRLDVTLG